ncbi:hypothetical protein ABC383_08870 [Noviherbaspirillum sp. 1P10PC]|jgi:hypothetical protein|uniref:hypothetical protein n=1 Tax=Noviherbaspirillum sp. 1P10PC TaxID=3132292 RepID=UPI00399EFA05
MAAVTYTKQDWKAEADIQRLPDGTYQGVVLLTRMGSPGTDSAPQTVNSVSETPEEALEEAKALAHRLLADVGGG